MSIQFLFFGNIYNEISGRVWAEFSISEKKSSEILDTSQFFDKKKCYNREKMFGMPFNHFIQFHSPELRSLTRIFHLRLHIAKNFLFSLCWFYSHVNFTEKRAATVLLKVNSGIFVKCNLILYSWSTQKARCACISHKLVKMRYCKQLVIFMNEFPRNVKLVR